MVDDMSSGPKVTKAEKMRQEGREEVLEWLRAHEVIAYSIPENVYFKYDRKSEMMLVLPWRKAGDPDVG